MAGVLSSGLDIYGLANAQYSLVVYVDVLVVPQVIVDPAVPLIRALCVNLLDLFSQALVFCRPFTFYPGAPLVIGRPGNMENLAAT